MKEYNKYLAEITSQSERSFLDASRAIDIQNALQKGGIDAELGGYGKREYLEFEFRGKRYEVIQVDQPDSRD